MRKMSAAGVASLAMLTSPALYESAPPAWLIERLPAAQAAPAPAPAETAAEQEASTPSDESVQDLARERYGRDLEAMREYRPRYPFWRHVYTVPDGRIAFGSAADGRLLATFPRRGNWRQGAHWEEDALADRLADHAFEGGLVRRRREAARVLAQAAGPVVHHATRGSFIAEGAERYAGFLAEWGAIFERFGVPAELGLAQGLVESGLKGRIRSEADAIGFCQWLPRNWSRLQRLSPDVIEAQNQTTQVPYCAAHLAILAMKYGSFVPALSEHHAGGLNVGRTIVNGGFAGGENVRSRYLLGAELTLLVRETRPPGYRDVVGTYGPRSFRYAEMVFGNTRTIAELESSAPQEQVFAMRAPRAIPLDEVTRRTGLSVDEVRRFNPALINRVPAGATLYLPFHVEDFGADVAFWHREASPEYEAVLRELVSRGGRYSPEDWSDGAVVEALRAFASRFRATGSEEGTVMAATIEYVIEQLDADDRMRRLAEFRSSERVLRSLEQGVRERQTTLTSVADGGGAGPGTLLSALSLSVQ